MGVAMVDVLLNWLNLFHFLILEGGLPVILINYMIFLSPFVGFIGMSMSTVSFLAHLEILSLECFSLTYNLNGFKCGITDFFYQ